MHKIHATITVLVMQHLRAGLQHCSSAGAIRAAMLLAADAKHATVGAVLYHNCTSCKSPQ
jgi:hypothetical protein